MTSTLFAIVSPNALVETSEEGVLDVAGCEVICAQPCFWGSAIIGRCAGDYLGLWGSDSVYSTEWRSRRSNSQRYIQHMMRYSTPAPWFCCYTHSFSPQKRVAFWNCFFLTCFVFCQKRSCFPFRSVLCWLIYG